MAEYRAYVGLDVYKDTIAVGVAWPDREVRRTEALSRTGVHRNWA